MKSPIHTLNEFDIEMCKDQPIKTEDIIPAFKENTTAIALVSSDEYAPFAAVVVASILKNAVSNYCYDIVIMTNDMLQRNRWRIQNLANNRENISIRILDISTMVQGLSFYTWAHFTSNTYYRLLIPDVFKNYEKVLYLDSDVVVNHDVSQLLQLDLDGYYLAAAYDTHVVSYCTRTPPLEQKEYNLKVLGMREPSQYFQAGVSLFNIVALRHDFEEGYLIKQGMNHQLRWLDQDLINKLFYGKIYRLQNRWNVMISNQPDNLDEYYLPEAQRKEYFEARCMPYIVHYVGRSIPCYTLQPDLYEYFWEYAKLTPFYEILIQRMVIDCSNKCVENLQSQMRHELRKEPLKEKLKKHIRTITDKLLPPGSRRRIYIKRFLFSLRKWS